MHRVLFLPSLKRCSGCRRYKTLDEFNRLARAADGRQWNCRACNAQWHADHKTHHNRLIAARNRRVAEQLHRRLFEYKLERGCSDCGEHDPTVLEFDHVRGKTSPISIMARYVTSWSKVLLELERCEVVCANCHRRRTSMRANDIRWKLYVEYKSRIHGWNST